MRRKKERQVSQGHHHYCVVGSVNFVELRTIISSSKLILCM